MTPCAAGFVTASREVRTWRRRSRIPSSASLAAIVRPQADPRTETPSAAGEAPLEGGEVDAVTPAVILGRQDAALGRIPDTLPGFIACRTPPVVWQTEAATLRFTGHDLMVTLPRRLGAVAARASGPSRFRHAREPPRWPIPLWYGNGLCGRDRPGPELDHRLRAPRARGSLRLEANTRASQTPLGAPGEHRRLGSELRS